MMGHVNGIQILNSNLNVRVVCWDISPGHLTGYYLCLGRPLLLILLLCYLDNFECTPASAGAERHICLVEGVDRILGSAPDARLPIVLFEHHPNHHECHATSTRKGDGDCEVNVVGCR